MPYTAPKSKNLEFENSQLSPNQSKYLQHRVRLQEFQSLSSHICPKAQSELINLQILNVATPTVPAPVLQLSRPRVLVAKSDWLVHCDVIVSKVFIKVIFCRSGGRGARLVRPFEKSLDQTIIGPTKI